jgi:hypothetical protein
VTIDTTETIGTIDTTETIGTIDTTETIGRINQSRQNTHTMMPCCGTHLHSVIRESEPRLTLAVEAPNGVEATGVAATNLCFLQTLIDV